MDDYGILSQIYDILNPRVEVEKQRSFFSTLIEEHAVSDVLDCACGTGLHLSLFHSLGISCSGSDISESMLEIAKINCKGMDIPLKREDFRTLDRSWNTTFGMVACLTTSLPHMMTEEDLHTALMSMYQRLNDGGILVISNGITDSILDTKPRFIPARENFDDAFYFVCDYQQDKTMTFNIVYVKHGDNGMEHVFTEITYSAMRKRTLEEAFQKTPFSEISYFGDFDFSPYSEADSQNLIVVAKK